MPGTRRSTRRSAATQAFSPTAEARKPQRKSRAAAPKKAGASRSPSPAVRRQRTPPAAASPKQHISPQRSRSPSPASGSYVTSSEFKQFPTVEWKPSILGLPSTDLLSVAICAFIGGRYVYKNDGITGAALHPTAFVSAWLTAFGGGLVCHIILTLATMSSTTHPSAYLRQALTSGTMGFQQTPALIAAFLGFAISVPIGHPYDASNIDTDIFTAMDCLNWGILVGWAVSKLAVLAVDVPSPPPLVLLAIAFPAGYAYCAAGGMTRDLLYTTIYSPSMDLPTNLQPQVAVPMTFGFAAYAVVLQLAQSVLPPVRYLDSLLGIPAVSYIFYLASTYLKQKKWDVLIEVPQVSLTAVVTSGGDVGAMIDGQSTSHHAATMMLTPLLVYLVMGLR